MKALDEYILMVLFVLLLKRVHISCKENLKVWPLKLKQRTGIAEVMGSNPVGAS